MKLAGNAAGFGDLVVRESPEAKSKGTRMISCEYFEGNRVEGELPSCNLELVRARMGKDGGFVVEMVRSGNCVGKAHGSHFVGDLQGVSSLRNHDIKVQQGIADYSVDRAPVVHSRRSRPELSPAPPS